MRNLVSGDVVVVVLISLKVTLRFMAFIVRPENHFSCKLILKKFISFFLFITFHHALSE